MTMNKADDELAAAGARAGEEPTSSRRGFTALLGALGAAALAGCAEQVSSDGVPLPDLDELSQALTGSGVLNVADTAANLRTITGGTTLWIAALQGIAVAGDGGGGIFYWSSVAQPDDGWSVLNSGSGNSAGWRRINPGVSSVPNMTALRAQSSGVGIAVMQGYHVPGDGGGGVFAWSTTAATDDGGVIVNPAGGSNPGWRRIYSGAVSVKWFGAKGDNATNDQPAIQAAIDSLKLTGGVVFFPAGTYKISSQIALKQANANEYNGITLQGVGYEYRPSPQLSAGSCIKAAQAIRDPVNGFGMLYFRGIGGAGDLNYSLKDVGVRNLRVSGYDEIENGGQLIGFSNTDRSFVIDSCVDTNRYEGMYWNGGPKDRNITVRGNYATRVGGWSASSGFAVSAYNINAHNVTMIGNRAFEVAKAIEQTGDGGVIADNIFEEISMNLGAVANRTVAMDIATTAVCKRLIIHGNTIRGAGAAVSVSTSAGLMLIANNIVEKCVKGILVVNSGAEVVVRDNYLYDTYNPSGHAIEHSSSTATAAIIENNTIVAGPTSNWAYAIRITSPLSPDIVRGNVVIGNAATTAVFVNNSPAPNRNIDYLDNIVRPGTMADGIPRYSWTGTGGASYSKVTFSGIDNGTVISTARPSLLRHSGPPSSGTWSVGDMVVNTQPTISGPLGAQYTVEGWVCVAAGSPGTWAQKRTLTGT